MLPGNIKRVHMIGIGGAGMAGMAKLLLESGYVVSGSDVKKTALIDKLIDKGARVYIGHESCNPGNAELVIFSSAIDRGNPELEEAHKRNIPCMRRGSVLPHMMKGKTSIVVSGTHGKTTTAAMSGAVLMHSGHSPTILVGGESKEIDGGACLGEGSFFLVESDESDGSFLELSPDFSLITNIEADHLDYYKGLRELLHAFEGFVEDTLRGGGCVIAPAQPRLQKLLGGIRYKKDRVTTYGVDGEDAQVLAGKIKVGFPASSFTVHLDGQELGEARINLPGMYNVRNAIGAFALGFRLGIDFAVIKEALSNFSGVKRRFEIKGKTSAGAVVVNDYAHHPTEIRAVLSAIRCLDGGRVIVIFQPHRFTRTLAFRDEFGQALGGADIVLVTGVYPAGDAKIEGVTGAGIVKAMRKSGHKNVMFTENKDDAISYVRRLAREGDTVAVLGAGDIEEAGDELARAHPQFN